LTHPKFQIKMETYINALVTGKITFTAEMARDAAKAIMDQQATPAQVGAFLIALKLTGRESDPSMIAAVASAMRDASLQIDFSSTDAFRSIAPQIVDIVGTGGDGQNTFNVSTASGIVAAGAGLYVAKVTYPVL
jgi:anthranilate phosphoribosyltransferase